MRVAKVSIQNLGSANSKTLIKTKIVSLLCSNYSSSRVKNLYLLTSVINQRQLGAGFCAQFGFVPRHCASDL